MPGIRRILETALDCIDLRTTAEFYRHLFDAAPSFETDRLVVFDAGEGTLLLLFQRGHTDAFSTPGGMIPGHQAGGPGHFAFAIDATQLTAWEEHLAQLGVVIESRVRWERGGTSLYFRDPDGRSVELVTPGIWPTY